LRKTILSDSYCDPTGRAPRSERWLSGRKRRFAKPLDGVNSSRGFESPPLRSIPSGTDRTRQSPTLATASGVSPDQPFVRSSRQEATGPAPTRPQTATPNATRALPDDPGLGLIVERWEQLPEAVRAGIVAMVKASGKGGGR
jgi:hypothetical protein